MTELGLSAGATLDDPTVHAIAQRVQDRPGIETSPERARLAEHSERIKDWLEEKPPLRMSKIWTLLTRDHDLDMSYATLRRYARVTRRRTKLSEVQHHQNLRP